MLMSSIIVLTMGYTAEFTPGAYIPSDLDNFGKTYAPDIVGKRPKLVSIDAAVIAHSFQRLLPDLNDLQRNSITYTNFQQLSRRGLARGRTRETTKDTKYHEG